MWKIDPQSFVEAWFATKAKCTIGMMCVQGAQFFSSARNGAAVQQRRPASDGLLSTEEGIDRPLLSEQV